MALSPPDKPKGTLARSGLGLGLAFIVGIATFFAVLTLMRTWMPGPSEKLTPPAERPLGAVAMPVYGTEQPWDLADHRGKVVIVNYFATWCPPCIGEMPALKEIAGTYASKGVITVAISLDKDNEREPGITRDVVVGDFAKEYQVTFPILKPPTDSMHMRNSIPIPQTAIYDKQGRRALHIMGPVTEKELRSWLDQLLAE